MHITEAFANAENRFANRVIRQIMHTACGAFSPAAFCGFGSSYVNSDQSESNGSSGRGHPRALAVLTYKVRSTSTPVYLHRRITERATAELYVHLPSRCHLDRLFQAWLPGFQGHDIF